MSTRRKITNIKTILSILLFALTLFLFPAVQKVHGLEVPNHSSVTQGAETEFPKTSEKTEGNLETAAPETSEPEGEAASTEVQAGEDQERDEANDVPDTEPLVAGKFSDKNYAVIVRTYEDLKIALSEDNGYQFIRFEANITADGSGISVHPNKPQLILDGNGYKFTQAAGRTSSSTIAVDNRSAVTTSVILRNLTIDGQNKSGVITIRDSLADSLTLTFENVNYTGPQPVSYSDGRVQFIGGSYFLTTSDANELAKAKFVDLGGNLKVYSTAASSAILRLTSSSSVLTILENANVQIGGLGYFTSGHFALTTLEPGSRLLLNTSRYGFSYTTDSVDDFIIAENASFAMSLDSTYSYAALRVAKSFVMQPGSSATIIRTGTDGIPLRLTDAKAQVILNQPKRVFFYSSSGVPLRFTGSGTLALETSAINLWTNTSWPLTTNVYTEPTHIWNKNNDTSLILNASYKTDTIQSMNHNLDGSDPNTSDLNTTNFNLNQSQLLALGDTYLNTDPIFHTQKSITGRSTPSAELKAFYLLENYHVGVTGGFSDENSTFSLSLPSENLLIDSITRLTSLADSLYYRQNTWVQASEDNQLVFSEVTPTIDFGPLAIPGSEEVVKRQEPIFKLSISDTRSNPTPWRIDGSIALPPRDNNHFLKSAFFFKGQEGEEITLSETATTIYRHAENTQGEVELLFGENEGPLLKLNPGEIYSETSYQAYLQWDLVDAP